MLLFSHAGECYGSCYHHYFFTYTAQLHSDRLLHPLGPAFRLSDVFRLRPPAGTYTSTGTDNVRTRNPHDQKYPLHLYPYRYDHRRLAGLRHDTVHYLPYVGPAHTVGIHFDSFSALLFRFTFNRHLFRYCGHDRHHLYVYRQSQWYRSHLYRRRDLIRHLFRRPLFTDVDQRPSDQRTDAD